MEEAEYGWDSEMPVCTGEPEKEERSKECIMTVPKAYAGGSLLFLVSCVDDTTVQCMSFAVLDQVGANKTSLSGLQ